MDILLSLHTILQPTSLVIALDIPKVQIKHVPKLIYNVGLLVITSGIIVSDMHAQTIITGAATCCREKRANTNTPDENQSILTFIETRKAASSTFQPNWVARSW